MLMRNQQHGRQCVFIVITISQREEYHAKELWNIDGVHDIGKATSYFQSVITRSCGEKYEEITGRGFVVNKVYRAEGRTPHSYAGQWILQSDTTGFGVPESLAMVVGAHHGRPMDMDPVDEEPTFSRCWL